MYGRATTDAAGGYRIALPPGVWKIRATWMQAFRGTTAEQTVVVRAGLTATADFSFDTGIR